MSRNYSDWLSAYIELVAHTEAPRLNHFWAGVGAIAGALRRKVWIDHGTFRWYPNFYVIFVAPPEVISKSVTAGVAMDILRDVPGINFGSDALTWQSMVASFAAVSESFEYEGFFHPMSALTYFSSELGLLVDFNDRALINVLIDLWDGRSSFKKETKTQGNDVIESPSINILACTTPSWIADSLPAVSIGGGFTSRCVFVYADKKEKLVAHPRDHIPKDFHERRHKLLQDLEHISMNAVGEFQFTDAAKEWEEKWYEQLWTVERAQANEEETRALQRRHTHLNKLAMILTMSHTDKLVIDKEDFELADQMLRTTALNHAKVFAKLGQTDVSQQTERFLEYVRRRGTVPYTEAYRYIHSYFPDVKDFEGIMAGLVKAGYVELVPSTSGYLLKAKA